MPLPPSSDSPRDAETIAAEAAQWLVRRDRGLNAAEQDAYVQWLTAEPRHAEVLAQHAAAFERMMKLYDWQPGRSANVNPDLFAPPPKPRWHRWGQGLAAAVLVLGAGLVWRQFPLTVAPVVAKSHLRISERQALPDGSVVELKDGSRIVVEFSPEERRVRLTGEAHFKVAKSPRPFVVLAGGVALRAVGTVFNVRLDADAVEVLVTEGRVVVAALDPVPAKSKTKERAEILPPMADPHWAEIAAGQRGIVPRSPGVRAQIEDVTPSEVQSLLEWQAPRLQFFETPLADAVAEFNRHNRIRLVVPDRALGAVPIGGTFRADNCEGFVRVLEITLEINAARRGDRVIELTRSP